LIFSGTVAVIIILISGIRFIVSGGEAKTVETAKKSMTYAILGLLLVFFSFMIVSVIGYVANVDCLTNIAKGDLKFTVCQTATPSSDTLPSSGY
jgi:glucose uptake protein GlcU